MGLGGLASALAKGINGYTRGTLLREEKDRQDKEDAFKATERARTLKTWEREDALTAGLADAMRPAQVDAGYQVTDDAGSNAFTKDADAAAVMQDMAGTVNTGAGLAQATRVNQTAYTDPALAKKAATEYDSTAARYGRAALATIPNDPAKGLQLQTSADAAAKAALERAKMMRAEGVGDAYRGILARDPQAIADGFNKSGTLMIEGLPKLVETRKVKTPFGEVDDDVWEATVVGADGSRRTVRQSAYQVGMQLYDVKDLLKDQTEAQKLGLSHVRKLAEIAADGEEDRKTKAVRGADGGAGDGKAPSGYRWTKDGDLEPIPGGPGAKPTFSSMDRMVIDGRVTAARSELRAVDDLLNEPLWMAVTEKSPSYPEKQRLLARRADAEAEYKKWSGYLENAATSAVDRAGLSQAPRATAPATKTALSVGQVVDGYRFKGGNPKDKTSWVKVN